MRQFSAGKGDFLRDAWSLGNPAFEAECDVSSACPHPRAEALKLAFFRISWCDRTASSRAPPLVLFPRTSGVILRYDWRPPGQRDTGHREERRSPPCWLMAGFLTSEQPVASHAVKSRRIRSRIAAPADRARAAWSGALPRLE